MAFAAPVVAEVATAGGTAAAASGAAGAAGAAEAGGAARAGGQAAAARPRKLASTGEKASEALPRRRAQRQSTAAGRADELLASGGGRGRARRALMDEFGASGPEADRLLDDAEGRRPADEPTDEPADEPARPRGGDPASRVGSAIGGAAGRGIGGALNAGGGLLLGAVSYVLALVFLRDGTDGLKRWVAAKFLNKVPSAATPAKTTPATTTTDGALRLRTRGDVSA